MAATIETELNELDRNLTALRVDYERFFAGDLKQPPIHPRRRVEETLKRLGNMEIEKPAERFRLQALQSRYNAMRELWEKRLAAREEGRAGPGRHVVPAVAPAGPGTDAGSGGSVQPRKRVSFAPLFERYMAARKDLGEDVSKIRYEKFEELVRKQAEEIRRQTGSTKLSFEVQTVDGKVRLIGRPAAPKGTP